MNGSSINLNPGYGELLLNRDLNIDGPGAGNLAISGQNQTRVFQVAGTVTISGLTIENGSANYPYGNFGFYGGGILNAGTLTIAVRCRATAPATAAPS